MNDTQKAATPHSVLVAQLLDPRIPKTEREHAAARELSAAIARAEKAEAALMELLGKWSTQCDTLQVAEKDLAAAKALIHADIFRNAQLEAEVFIARDMRERAEAERDEARAELARLTTLRPASAWDGETYVLWWHEFDDAGWAPVAISNIQATSHWTPVFDAQVQRAGGCVNSLHSEASTSGREPAHPIPTPKEPT